MKNENENINKISQWLEQVSFRKQFFGGLNEEDVWKKINELNEMYEAALEAERIRYNAMLEMYGKIGEELENGELAHDD